MAIYIFPIEEFSIYVLTFYILKSVRRKAEVCFKMCFSKTFLNSIEQKDGLVRELLFLYCARYKLTEEVRSFKFFMQRGYRDRVKAYMN